MLVIEDRRDEPEGLRSTHISSEPWRAWCTGSSTLIALHLGVRTRESGAGGLISMDRAKTLCDDVTIGGVARVYGSSVGLSPPSRDENRSSDDGVRICQQLEEAIDVLGSDAEAKETFVHLADVGRRHLGVTVAATVEYDVAAGTSLDQAALTEMPPGIGCEVVRTTPLGQETIERGRHANDELVVGAGTVGCADFASVEVLRHQPAAWGEPGDQLIENVESCRDVLQHEPFVDQIPRALRDRSGHHVELTHLELRVAVVLEPSGVEIHGDHLPLRPNPGGEPTRDGTTPGTDLQAAGARADTDAAQVTDRDRIEYPLQTLEPCRRLRMHVAHQVRGLRHRDHLDTQA